jgi:hypothetical protein
MPVTRNVSATLEDETGDRITIERLEPDASMPLQFVCPGSRLVYCTTAEAKEFAREILDLANEVESPDS